MSDIYALLNINQGILKDFPLQAERVADHQTEKMITQHIRQLKEIEDRMLVNKGIEIPEQSIDEVITKVVKWSKTGNVSRDNWSMRELRIVSYYMMKLTSSPDSYSYAIKLLDANWKDMFFNGLVFYLLNSWNNIEPELRSATCELVKKKLAKYNGNIKRYCLLKEHASFFNDYGPAWMAEELKENHIDLGNAPELIGFNDSTIKQSYYSAVIVKYVENNDIQDYDTLEDIFDRHGLDRTKKLVLANLVEKADDKGDDVERSLLCKFINRVLGDVTLASTWAPFPGATEADAQKLKKAMKLVNMWFTQQIIEVFFDVCVQDQDRRNFWLDYVSYVSGFKIVGSSSVKHMLQSNQKIGGMFQRHFIETNSRYSQTSALVLFIKNKMIVEFSDYGALYVYNQAHYQVKKVIGRRYINSTNDLKVPSMGMIIQSTDWGTYYYYDEGRMTHQGYWQRRLSGWLQKMVLSKEHTGTSFLDTKDDDIFKAQPLEKEPKEKVKVQEDKVQNIGQKKAQYDKNIWYVVSSKWIYDNQYRIVANSNGFYLNISTRKEFVKIKDLKPGEFASGNIWIRKPYNDGWRAIVHAMQDKNYNIGFIKQEVNGSVLYKETISEDNPLVIK